MKYRWFFIYLFFCLVFVGGCKKKRDLSKIDYLKNLQSISDDSVFLIISGSVEGYVESCGCTSKPLGDIARFAQVFEDIKSRSKNPPILINSGNLLFDTESRNDADLCQDNARIELLLSTLSGLGLKYTISGPLD
ncbi:MAG TPA: hypothetical protein VGZ71_09220, partial [Puia sp.]|nr:hypothetical protein [Puia sp.]